MTDQQKAELRGRGFEIWHGCLMLDPRSLLDPGNDEDRLYLQRIAEAATILGIQIPGCRLVPEEVAEAMLPQVRDMADEDELAAIAQPEKADVWRKLAKQWSALASALSPKEVEKR